jgi:hypothetical protein
VVKVDTADRAAGMVARVVKAVVRVAKVDQAEVPVDHAAESVNISVRRKFASSAWKRWT